jgi:hypothetical protein
VADQSDDSIELVDMEASAEEELEATRAVWAAYVRQVLYARFLLQSPVQWASEPPRSSQLKRPRIWRHARVCVCVCPAGAVHRSGGLVLRASDFVVSEVTWH